MIDVSVECMECGATLDCSISYGVNEIKFVVERCTCEDEAIRDAGSEDGYNHGFNEGEEEGYREGYAEGKVDGEKSVNSFINLVAKTKTGE